MANVTLSKVLEEVKMLSPNERRQLRELLDTLLEEPPPAPTEEEFARELLQEGIISEIKPPITDFAPYKNRKPFEVKGKPLSEIIIEERR